MVKAIPPLSWLPMTGSLCFVSIYTFSYYHGKQTLSIKVSPFSIVFLLYQDDVRESVMVPCNKTDLLQFEASACSSGPDFESRGRGLKSRWRRDSLRT